MTQSQKNFGRSVIILIALAVAAAFILGVFIAEPVRGWLRTAESDASDGEETTQWYISGMHPWIIRPGPGHCPICNMELTPLSPGMLSGELTIDPVIVRNIGVRIQEVERGLAAPEIWAPLEVTMDEALIRRVTARAGGYVERLFFPCDGDRVTAGEPLAEIFSPQINAAAHELLAVAGEGRTGPLLETARARLRVLGVSESQIDEIVRTGDVPRVFTVLSPITGYVTEAPVRTGAWVGEGDPLAELVGDDRVWFVTSLATSQISFAREGARLEVTFPEIPGRTFEAEVDLVYPQLEPDRRQVRLRAVVQNDEGHFRPGMFGRALLRLDEPEGVIVVPRTAIVDTGQRQIVFVSLGDGRFDPREVTVGIESATGAVQIIDGVQPGEQVVVSGQFMLDSESRMREALLKMVRGEQAFDQQVIAAGVALEGEVVLDAAAEEDLTAILTSYFRVSGRLVEDAADGVAQESARLEEAAGRWAARATGSLAQALQGVADAAHRMTHVSGVREARLALRDVSDALRPVLRVTGTPAAVGEVHEVRCPMFPELGQNAYWFQPPTRTANPYMGQSMLGCMDQRVTLPATGARRDAPAEETRAEEPEAPRAIERSELPAESAAALGTLINSYLQLTEELVNDREDGLVSAGRALFLHAVALEQTVPAPGEEERLLIDYGARLARADTLDAARRALRDLSPALIALVERAGALPGSPALEAVRCPMFPDFGESAWWIQPRGDIRNPYMGQGMLACADRRRELP